MTSSKKKRGKQRKAAKNLAAANNISGSDEVVIRQVVALVQRGNKSATEALSTRALSEVISLEIIGVLPCVLGFLKKFEDEMFATRMALVGGDLLSPSTWIRLLLKASILGPISCVQIANNIGPLVRCMCNDTKRLFFKSNKHWKDSIMLFIQLIHSMLYVKVAPDEKRTKVVDTLLQYEGLLTSIVQWGFWENEYRPDITKELGVEKCANISQWGKSTTVRVMALVTNAEEYTGDVKLTLETIATTSIVSKEYDPNCMVSYVAGMIRMSKATGDISNFSVIRCFVKNNIDCVDKGVMTEFIDFGINYITCIDTASIVASLSATMLFRDTNILISVDDTRTAFAVRVGLIEMCLSFIERFGTHESFADDDSLFSHIQQIFGTLYCLSLHKKSAKAIGHKKNKIEKELSRLEKNAGISSNDECRKLLDIVRFVLDLNGAYCCRCNKSLSRKDIKRCNGCNRLTYCSKACQREDWLNGHDVTYNKSCTREQAGVFQGRCLPVREPESERAAAKLEALEQNVNMIQLKLFLDNSDTIQSQASSLGIPLHDCIVHFDLHKCPLSVEVQSYSEFYKSYPGGSRWFEEGRSKENITCIYYSLIRHGYIGEDGDDLLLIKQKFFPHEWLSTKSTQK